MSTHTSTLTTPSSLAATALSHRCPASASHIENLYAAGGHHACCKPFATVLALLHEGLYLPIGCPALFCPVMAAAPVVCWSLAACLASFDQLHLVRLARSVLEVCAVVLLICTLWLSVCSGSATRLATSAQLMWVHQSSKDPDYFWMHALSANGDSLMMHGWL